MSNTSKNTNEELFNELLREIKTQYERSAIAEHGYHYSVSSTELRRGVPLIVGFNWGVTKGHNHGPQIKYPSGLFQDIEDLGSQKRTISWFENHFKEGLQAVQTNICFFRSPKQNDIPESDIKLCLPIFNKLISHLNPSAIISFTQSILKYLEIDQDNDHVKLIKSGSKNISAIKSEYQSVPFYYLPHPNYPCTGDARTEAWKFCFDQ